MRQEQSIEGRPSRPKRPERSPKGALAFLRPYFRCRLCWQVTIFVFLSILVIEAAILVPSYLRHKQQLLDELEARGLAVLSASIHRQLEGSAGVPIFDFGDGSMIHPIVGLSLYSEAGNGLGSFGESVGEQRDPLSVRVGRPLLPERGERHAVLWTKDDLKAPLTAVATLDSGLVSSQLQAYVARLVAMTVIISFFVSAASMGVLTFTVLRPLLLLRRQMLRAQQAPERADEHLVKTPARHELGDMTEAFNSLVRELAGRYRNDLDASEQRFEDFARSASDWYWEMDETLRFSYFSERFEEVSSVPPEKLLGKTRQETGIPEVDPEAWRQHLEDLAGHRPFRNFVHPRRTESGEQVWLSINGQPHFDRDGRFRGYRGTGADITRLKQAEDALRVSRDRAEVASRAKSEFLANMSHEIRTPMTAVIGMAELLRTSPLSDDQRDKVETIIRCGEGLLVILNDILDLSRLEAGKLEIEVKSLDLEALLRSVLELMTIKAKAKGLDLSLTLCDEVPRRLHGDGTRIRQVLINLIGNAIKFTESGPIRVTVEPLRSFEGGIELRFAVEDSGIGISAADQDRLFEKFEQADSSTSRGHGGSGLGLAISKQLVELMGGEIGLTSRVSEGSTFWFMLPLRLAQSDEAEASLERSNATTAAKRCLEILLAEDNQINRMLLSSMLGRFGHRLALAENGREAVEAAERKAYDIVLMDIRMPVMDGLEATREIRSSNGPNRETPIIAVTADAMVDNEQAFLDAGVDAVATKPIRLPDLLATIDRSLGEAVHVTRTSGETQPAKAAPSPPGVGEGDAAALLAELGRQEREAG